MSIFIGKTILDGQSKGFDMTAMDGEFAFDTSKLSEATAMSQGADPQAGSHKLVKCT